jgi:hypothetical protein
VAYQYDTDAGLGRAFHNRLGCLMGCPLSPDKAKLLLNSIIVAISLQVKGVRLWGEGADEQGIRNTLLQSCRWHTPMIGVACLRRWRSCERRGICG